MIAGGADTPPHHHTGMGDLLMIVKVFLTNMKTSDTVRFLYPIEEIAARRYAYEVFYGSPTCDEETATDETVLEYTTLLDTTELVLSKGDA
jgi:hypothetical protein